MATIILSGVGGSTNWLPLIFPLVGVVIILTCGEFIIKFVKSKLHHESHTGDDMHAGFDKETLNDE